MINLLPKIGRQEGNLPLVKLPGRARKKRPPVSRRLLLLLGISLTFAGVATGVVEYYLLPQIQVKGVAEDLHPPLVEVKNSLERVNQDFGDLFTLISGEEKPPPQTSFFNLPALLEKLKEKVAGESAKFAFYDLLYQLRKDLLLISSSFSGAKDFGHTRGKEVAGAKLTQLEDEVTGELQLVRVKAYTCGESVTASRSKLLLLSASLPQQFPGPLVAVGTELGTLIQESGDYLLEAEKTARYYERISAIQIELVPATVSSVSLVQDLYLAPNPTIYLSKVNALAKTIDDLKRQVENLSGSLPAGMEKLHQDNLAVFALFSRLLTEMRTAVSKDDFFRFDKAVTEFEVELEVLATRAKTYELDFWQKTKLLQDYGELSSHYERIEAELVQLRR